jgi:chemotaxis protein MotB
MPGMRMRAFPLAGVPVVATLVLGASGCVTKTKHDALQRELDDTEVALRAEQESERQAFEEQLQTRNTRVTQLEAALAQAQKTAADLKEELASLQAAIDAKQEELASLGKRQADTERELAAALKKRADLKQSLDQMSAALEELRQRQREADKRVAEYRDLLAKFSELIDAGKLKVSIIDGRMVLTLPMDILFASGKADLTEDGRSAIEEVGKGLATIKGRQFQVEGHTDDVPIKTAKFPSNWELGAARALVVLRALVDGGVSAKQLSAATYGELHPSASNGTPEGRKANRRIEIVVVPDLSTLPGYDELNRLSKGGR